MILRPDVTIVGGGLAGLTLALQLKSSLPPLDVVVVERKGYPAPETTFKVGESLVEVSSWYLDKVLGVGDHLRAEHLPKLGLRFFMTERDNVDLGSRPEFGVLTLPHHNFDAARDGFPGLHLRTYNVARGRLENHLFERCLEAGAIVLDNTRVTEVTLGNPHEVVANGDGANGLRVRSRWIVDASGRVGFLARRLGLRKTQGHEVNTAWFRVDGRIDPDEWTEDRGFHGRTKPDLRWLSTNHLMGHGYWIWLIPLPTGATSVGIMTDHALHPFDQFHRIDKALAWLAVREPQLTAVVSSLKILDFHKMKAKSYLATRAFSRDRWALSGESAYFVDALYSPGGDFIAVGNTLITRMIEADCSGCGDRLPAYARFADQLLLGMFRHYFGLVHRTYRLMGNAGVMLQKVIWDTAIYFGYNVLLFRNDRFCSPAFHRGIRMENLRLDGLQKRMISRFAASAPKGKSYAGHFIDQSAIQPLWTLYKSSDEHLRDGNSVRERLVRNVDRLEAFSGSLEGTVG